MRKISDEAMRKGIELVNRGASWKEAAIAIGVSLDGLRKHAKRVESQMPVRRGKRAFRLNPAITLPGPEKLSYVAAMVDAEGHICIVLVPRRNVIVGISNTSVALMQELLKIGGRIARKSDNRLGKVPCYEWRLHSRADVHALLVAIEPYMIVKRDKAKLAIATLEMYREEWRAFGTNNKVVNIS